MIGRKYRVNLSRLFLGQAQENDRSQIDYRLHYQNGQHNHEYGAERETELALVASNIFKRLLDEEAELLPARKSSCFVFILRVAWGKVHCMCVLFLVFVRLCIVATRLVLHVSLIVVDGRSSARVRIDAGLRVVSHLFSLQAIWFVLVVRRYPTIVSNSEASCWV